MRLTTVILIATLVQVSAAGMAQRITMQKNNASLKEVFTQIKLQTGFDVVIESAQLKNTKPVHVNFKNAEIVTVLDELLPAQQLTYTIVDKTIVVKPKDPSLIDLTLNLVQSLKNLFKDLKGRVTDEQGKPLPNASIRIKGKSAVTNTDANGLFEIKDVADDAVLQVSYVGYKTLEIPVKGTVMPLEIKLNVATGELEEVKVTYNTGYQELNRERSTGSFVQIDNELFNRAVGKNVLDRILHVTSGLISNPIPNGMNGAPANIVIRGFSTINANKEALIVVDNFPYEGDLTNLNPNDIESITVLKDASAASIWGVRAGNGVIVITTKKGKFNQVTNVGFNSNITVGQKPDLFYTPYMSSKDIIEFEKLQFGKGIYNVYDDLYPRFGAFPVLPQSIEILLAARKNNKNIPGYNPLNDPLVSTQLEKLANHDVRDDINKYLIRNTINQQYTINLSGGGGNFNYYASLGYDKNKRSNLHENSNRFSVNFNNTWRPIKNLEISSSIVHTRVKNISSNSNYNAFLPSIEVSPYTALADEDGNALPIPKRYRTAYVDTASYPALLDWRYKPLENYKYINNNNQNYDTRLSAVLNYTIKPWLKAEFQYQNQIAQSDDRSQLGQQSFDVRDAINRFMIKDAMGKIIYPYPLGDKVNLSNSTLKAWNVRGSLHLDKQLNDHQVSALVGIEIRETNSETNFNTLYGYDSETYLSVPVSFTQSFPVRPSGTGIVGTFVQPDGNLTRNGSLFGNGLYSYKKKYLATISGRIDQSNFFGVKANLRRAPLWSAGLAWNMHQENFYNIKWLSSLKLKGSYGYNGNTNSGASSYATFRYFSGSEVVPPRNISYGEVLTPNNPQLRWERVKIINVGVDFATSSNRISGSIEIYNKTGLDLLAPIITDLTTGFYSYTGNQASIKGKGVDFSLNTRNILRGPFEWTTNMNISFNKDKVVAYKGELGDPATRASGSTVNIGDPLASIYSYRWGGLDPDNGGPRFYLADTISSYSNLSKAKNEDIIFSGQKNPRVFGNIINTFRWKQLSFSINITYRLGHHFRRSSINYNYLLNLGWSGHSDYALRWQKPGDELITDVPSLPMFGDFYRNSMYESSSILIEKADYIRLQDVKLNYNLNRSIFKNLPFKQVSLYAYAANLGIIWRANKRGLDPDAYSFGSTPSPKIIAFGLNADF